MSNSEKHSRPVADSVREAIESPHVPVVYANGFAIGMTNADVTLIWSLNNVPVERLHVSYTLAKTLHQRLAEAIEALESGVKRPMLTTMDVDKVFGRMGDKS